MLAKFELVGLLIILSLNSYFLNNSCVRLCLFSAIYKDYPQDRSSLVPVPLTSADNHKFTVVRNSFFFMAVSWFLPWNIWVCCAYYTIWGPPLNMRHWLEVALLRTEVLIGGPRIMRDLSLRCSKDTFWWVEVSGT